MKNSVKAFKILEESGFTKENAELFLVCIENDETAFATKGDLKNLECALKGDINLLRSDLIAEIHRQINNQTWKFLGGLVTIGAIFKGFDILVGHLK